MGQTGRYELKYVVDEERARAVAQHVQAYLRPSAHNGPRGHPVISLYMDSPDFFFYRQGFGGHKNRIKLRIRFYDDEWKRPAFMEIKRRVGEVICKDRAMISREGVRQFLNGGWPCPSYWPEASVLAHGKRRLGVYNMFWSLANRVRAQGIIYVSYLREIFEAPDDEELRVTLDREIRATLYDGSGRLHLPSHGVAPPPDKPPSYLSRDAVVIELKFDDRAPGWMYDMVRRFDLQRRPLCKYCTLIDGLGLQWGNRLNPAQEIPLSLAAALA